MPSTRSGPDWPPVNGSFVPVGVKTVVEVTTGAVVVVAPWPCSVVLVVDLTTVVPATFVVSVTGTVVLVVVVLSVTAGVGGVTSVVVVVDVLVVDVLVVVDSLVVVVSCGSVTGVVVVEVHSHVVLVLTDVVEHPQCVVLVGGNEVEVEH